MLSNNCVWQMTKTYYTLFYLNKYILVIKNIIRSIKPQYNFKVDTELFSNVNIPVII